MLCGAAVVLAAGSCVASGIDTELSEPAGIVVGRDLSDVPRTSSVRTTGTAAVSTSLPGQRTVERIAYGTRDQQFGILRIPAGDGPHPVVVLIHGGFWRSSFTYALMEPLATDLVDRGYATWNLEYRSIGHLGGGYPGTFDDVGAGIDHLDRIAAQHDLAMSRVAIVGHSAGGHLALWSGSRHRLADGEPGANPVVKPSMVIGQAPVTDMYAAGSTTLGGGAAAELLGGTPAEVPDRYELAQPRFDGTVGAAIVIGSNDGVVPREFSLPAAGDPAEIVTVDGADHFAMIDPDSAAWEAVLDLLRSL